jgi:hypothetical protein
MSDVSVIDSIAQYSKAEEVAELVGQYRALLNNEEIKVDIYHRPNDGHFQYSVDAYVSDNPERRGFGNGGATIDEALATYHWDKLAR